MDVCHLKHTKLLSKRYASSKLSFKLYFSCYSRFSYLLEIVYTAIDINFYLTLLLRKSNYHKFHSLEDGCL